MAGSQFANQYRYMLNAWHPVRNPNSDIPRAGAKSDAALPSDFMIHDAVVHVRPQEKMLVDKDLTLSVSGENLFLWKKYNGFDPEFPAREPRRRCAVWTWAPIPSPAPSYSAFS